MTLCDLMECVLRDCLWCVASGAREKCHTTCVIDGIHSLEYHASKFGRQEGLRVVYRVLWRLRDVVDSGQFETSTHFTCVFLHKEESLSGRNMGQEKVG